MTSSKVSELWAAQLAQVQPFTPGWGSQTLLAHLRPSYEYQLVLQQHAQTREMATLDDFNKCWPSSPSEDWLKQMAQHNKGNILVLCQFLRLIHTLRQILEQAQKKCPQLWKIGSQLQSDTSWLQQLEQSKSLKPEHQQRLKQRLNHWRTQERLIAQLGLILAKARYLKAENRQLLRLSHDTRIHLIDWKAPQLERDTAFNFEVASSCHAVLLNGAHGVGKTRLLNSLYLSCMLNQSGLPLKAHEKSCLPVFSGIWLFDSQQSLSERFEQLKPLLKTSAGLRLILLDDFPGATSPAEGHALARALLEHFSETAGLMFMSSHHHQLSKWCHSHEKLKQLSLSRPQKHMLSMSWGATSAPSQLLDLARRVGWPQAILQKANGHLLALKAEPPSLPKAKPTPPQPSSIPVKPVGPALSKGVVVGSWVYIPKLNQYGELLSLPDRKQRVLIKCQNGVQLEIAAQDVLLSSHRKEKKANHNGIHIQTWSNVSNECDLHGLRVTEAILVLEKFIDTASHQNHPQVRIIHGKGTSVLRQAVHDLLRDYLQQGLIQDFRLGLPGEGDSGVTIISLI